MLLSISAESVADVWSTGFTCAGEGVWCDCVEGWCGEATEFVCGDMTGRGDAVGIFDGDTVGRGERLGNCPVK